MKYYKLTTQSLTTHNNTQWEVGEWKTTSGIGPMCSPGWLHCYSHPELAIVLNPGHAAITNPRLWEIETDGKHTTDGLKHATSAQRLVREFPVPVIPYEHILMFSVLCVDKYYSSNPPRELTFWASKYLSGKVNHRPPVGDFMTRWLADVFEKRTLWDLSVISLAQVFHSKPGIELAWERAKELAEHRSMRPVSI